MSKFTHAKIYLWLILLMGNLITLDYWFVNVFGKHFTYIVEKNVKVITSLGQQNALISSCHDGLSSSIQSIASSGHLGM